MTINFVERSSYWLVKAIEAETIEGQKACLELGTLYNRLSGPDANQVVSLPREPAAGDGGPEPAVQSSSTEPDGKGEGAGWIRKGTRTLGLVH